MFFSISNFKILKQWTKAIALWGKYLLLSAIVFSFLVFPLIGWSLNVQDVPNPRQQYGGWVTDMAQILSPDIEAELNSRITGLEITNGAEIAVVTVVETQPAASPKAFATELFNTWGIGKADRNNGVLLLVSTGDRRVEIITGSGLEQILPDEKVGQIIQREIVPQFKQNNFPGGTLAGTKAIIRILEGNSNPIPTQGNSNKSEIVESYYLFSALLLFVAGLNYFIAKWMAQKPIFVPYREIKRLRKSDPLDRNIYIVFGLSIFCIVFAGVEIAIAMSLTNGFAIFLWVFLGSGYFIILQVRSILTGNQSVVMQTLKIVLTFLFLWPILLIVFGLLAILLIASLHSFLVNNNLANLAILSGSVGAILGFIFAIHGSRKYTGQIFKKKEDCLIRPVHCESCDRPMERLEDRRLITLLTPPERVARELGSVGYEGWFCSTCVRQIDPNLRSRSNIHLRQYERDRKQFYPCPHCQELTATRTPFQVTIHPTSSHPGRKKTTEKCHCCSYSLDIEQSIPRTSSSSSNTRWNNSSNTSWSSDDSSSSSGSDGGSDFGGGSSDGGGDGGDW